MSGPQVPATVAAAAPALWPVSGQLPTLVCTAARAQSRGFFQAPPLPALPVAPHSSPGCAAIAPPAPRTQSAFPTRLFGPCEFSSSPTAGSLRQPHGRLPTRRFAQATLLSIPVSCFL